MSLITEVLKHISSPFRRFKNQMLCAHHWIKIHEATVTDDVRNPVHILACPRCKKVSAKYGYQ